MGGAAGCSPTAPGRCLHFECRGAPARVPGVEMRGSPPLAPPLCVCGDVYLTLPYLTLPSKKKERKRTTQGRDGRTARRHHTGILRRGVWCASRRPPLGVRLFLSLFAVSRRFSLRPSCGPIM